MARRIKEECRRSDVALMHFHYQYASVVGARVARRQGLPYVTFTHGSLNRYGISRSNAPVKRIYLALFEKWNFQKALFLAYHSQEEMDNSLRFGRAEVVPNGIDPRDFGALPERGLFRQKYPESDGRLTFLFLGRLAPGKGIDILVKAFRRVASQTNAHLFVVGGDERGYESGLRQLVADFGLQEHITFTGPLTGEAKLSALRDADVFVLPSFSEGLSIAMLEAMFMKLPVVTTDRVGLHRQIREKHCGLVVPPDTDSFAQALLRIAGDPARAEAGERGHRLVAAHYTWSKIAQELIEMIRASMHITRPTPRF